MRRSPFTVSLFATGLTALVMTLSPLCAVHAQHSVAPTASPAPTAPKEGTQFDFLVGQWDLTVTPKATTLAQRIHGVPKLIGTWKAWRAFDGWGIEDELRVTDGSGNPRLLTHATRYFENAAHRWAIASIDVYKSIVSTLVGELHGTDMQLSGQGKDDEGKAYVSRATFSKITGTSFSYQLDRSYDGGKTWTEGVTTIVAKRAAAVAPR